MIRGIEDLKIRRRGRALTSQLYKTTGTFPKSERHNLVSQIRRAAISIPGDIAEGFGRLHYKESSQFYRMARGSLFEVKSHLYVAKDLGYVDDRECRELLEETDLLGKMINTFIQATGKIRRPRQPSRVGGAPLLTSNLPTSNL